MKTSVLARLSLSILVFGPVASVQAEPGSDFFENKIRPVLIEKCGECHKGTTPEGNLSLTSLSLLMKGGQSGPSLVIGKPDQSRLIQRMESTDPKKKMPPEEALSPEVIADFRKWIRDGAVWPAHVEMNGMEERAVEDHWAFRPVKRPEVPEVRDRDWCRTDIDRFIRAEQERRKITPLGLAAKPVWLRRVTFDLTGLPPTPAEIAAFVADESPAAWENVVDRLLSSPAYGERWGRHWLDLARYADTSGDGTDMPVPEARYYRDYVIAAFNRDMPFPQFLTEQIAGDQLAKQTPDDPRNHEKIIATGYIALSRRFGNSRYANQELIIDDTIDTIGRSVLGLSLGCTRCHHHKFDPVTSEDYYGLYGYFESTQYPHAGTEHQKDRLDFVPMKVPEEQQPNFDSAVAWAVSDKSQCADVKINVAGDPGKKGAVAPRGFIASLTPDHPKIPAGESGRLQLAEWLVSPSNPLTARVLVNRVWQYHFGRGFVPNSSNFGRQSPPPTHPALLDWLAADFVEHGWTFKRLHRQLVLSTVYRLESGWSDHAAEIDQANDSLWSFRRQRLDAEALRDSLLAVSGSLESGSGGRHPFPAVDKLKFTQGNPFTQVYDHNRRSVYLMSGRLMRHPFLVLFDGPDTNRSTEIRGNSTVPLQALFSMNSTFMSEKSAAFARRLIAAENSDEARIALAYQLAFGRSVENHETSDALQYLRGYEESLAPEKANPEAATIAAWTSLARILLTNNEFVYID